MLTAIACRAAEPRSREYKLTDHGGLFLRVKPSGHKTFCWKYRYAGREKRLTIGTWPAMTLKQARLARDRAREKLEAGIDPALEKKLRKLTIRTEAANTFEAAARAWHGEQTAHLSRRYAGQILDRLIGNVFPLLGPMPIRAITPQHVLAAIRQIEDRGAHEMAHRVRLHMSDVFVWAIASGLADADPAALVRKALRPTDPQLRPAQIKLTKARDVLIRTEASEGAWWSTLLASRLLALTAARPGVVRLAERHEFEDLGGPEPLWRIPAAKMKLTRKRKRDVSWEFVVPLSRQAVAVVQAAMAASRSPSLIFPSASGARRPMSDSTLSKLYRQSGLAGLHVPHGWRSSFSTIMNELAAVDDRENDRAVIDLMLAHAPEGVEPVYNRAAYMPRRRAIAQAWADLLMPGLPPPQALVPAGLRIARETAHERRPDRRRPLGERDEVAPDGAARLA